MKYTIHALITLALLSGCAGPDRPRPRSAAPMPAPKEPPPVPVARNERLNPAFQAAARKELDTALTSKDPFIRSNAIEAARIALGASAKSIFLTALQDKQIPVRFAAAMAIGQLQIAEARPQLLQMINEPNQRVGLGVRFALHKLGDTTYSKDFETMATDPDPRVRGTVAMVLGLLGEPTAVRVLRPMQRDREAVVRLQVAEALWRLGNEDGLKTLVAQSASGYPDDQAIALMGLAMPKDRRVLGHIRAALTADYTEVTLVAARAAGMLGSDMGYTVANQNVTSRDPRQRALAALALGSIGRADAQTQLSELLKERESAEVRLCAAQALLELQGATWNARTE